MKLLALFIFAAATSFAQVSTHFAADKTTFPDTVSGIPWAAITNYGARGNTAQGVGVSYRGENLKIDIYYYDTLNADWADLPVKQRIEREAAAISDIFRQFTERGDYSNVNIKPSRTVTAGQRAYTHTEIDFTDRQAGELNSHYYLTELNGRILKIRISQKKHVSPRLAEPAFREIADAFSKRAGVKRGGSPRARELIF